LGIGKSSPGARLDVVANDARFNLTSTGSGQTVGISIKGGAGGGDTFNFIESLNSGGTQAWYLGSNGTANTLAFKTNGNNERMRIDSSGKLFLGTTSTISAFNNKYRQVINPFTNGSEQYGLMVSANANSLTQYAVVFADTFSETIVGSIRFTTSATSYVTSSDYRLKNTIAPMTGALAKVALLKPVTYKWNVDGSDSQGFIAHELAEIVPECVTGEKDAVDEEGNPKYQGIDTSFLVATLTAAIQEQQALIQDLTTRLAKLEAK
jgi:hypothetical protein